MGQAFGVTGRTIRRDGVLAEGVARVVANCGAAARRALLAADHQVTRRGIVRLAKQDAAAQQAALRYLLQHQRLPPHILMRHARSIVRSNSASRA